jgi:hypothetical protein
MLKSKSIPLTKMLDTAVTAPPPPPPSTIQVVLNFLASALGSGLVAAGAGHLFGKRMKAFELKLQREFNRDAKKDEYITDAQIECIKQLLTMQGDIHENTSGLVAWKKSVINSMSYEKEPSAFVSLALWAVQTSSQRTITTRQTELTKLVTYQGHLLPRALLDESEKVTNLQKKVYALAKMERGNDDSDAPIQKPSPELIATFIQRIDLEFRAYDGEFKTLLEAHANWAEVKR